MNDDNARTTEQKYREEKVTEENLRNMDVYTADGQLVGTVIGFAAEVPEDRRSMERGPVDTLDAHSQPIGSRHLVIDGYGYPAQVQITVPEDQADIDLRGRRVTLRLTMAQVREMPHRDSFTPSNPPINAGTSELGYADPDLL